MELPNQVKTIRDMTDAICGQLRRDLISVIFISAVVNEDKLDES